MKQRWLKPLMYTMAGLFMLFTGTALWAQTGGSDLPPMQWYSKDDPIALGQGAELSTQGMGSRSSAIDNIQKLTVAGQPEVKFESSDFSQAQQVLNSLKVNVWAAASGLFWSGKVSFDLNKFSASNVNERVWQVDAVWRKTVFLGGDPTLTGAAAKILATNSTQFSKVYGNFFASAITYRKRCSVRFRVQITKQCTEEQIRAALSLSVGCFSGGGSVEAISTAFSQIGETSVQIEVDGLPGSDLIKVATGGDIKVIQDKTGEILARFDNANDGIIDMVKLRAYSSLNGYGNVSDPIKTPSEDALNTAFSAYIRIEQVRRRLIELKTRSFHSKVLAYLKTKSAEVETKRSTILRYIKYVYSNPGQTAPALPNTDVIFDDPEIVRWQLVGASKDYLNSDFKDPLWHWEYEVYGEVNVSITQTTKEQDGWSPVRVEAVDPYDPTKWVPWQDAFNLRRDPVTGIAFRRIRVWQDPAWSWGKTSGTFIVTLKNAEGNQYFLATDRNSARQVMLTLTKDVWGGNGPAGN